MKQLLKKNQKLTKSFYDFGIGEKTVSSFYSKFGVNLKKSPKFLKENSFNKINSLLKKAIVGKKLQKNISKNLEFSILLKTYKGVRHKLKYPVRGQRTHTNAKTKKKFIFKKV